MKAVTYLRVSTEVQDYNRQKDDIERYCKAHSIEIVEEFAEKESGKNKNREQIKSLLNYLESNEVDFVIVSELSRLGRTSEVLLIIETLNPKKIGLIALKENLKTLNDDKTVNHTTTMITGVMASLNSYELETMKYRSKSGLLRSALSGNWGGGKYLPYGYMREGKKLVVNPSEAEMVKEVFKLSLEGNGTLKIANILNFKNYPTRTGVVWRDKTVYDILKNPIYIGKRRYKGPNESILKVGSTSIKVKDKQFIDCPRIIDDYIFDAVQTRLKENYSKIGINTKFEHLLNDRIIKCGVCGKSYFAHKRMSGTDNAYKCISIRYRENCGNTGISIDKLDIAIKILCAVPLLTSDEPIERVEKLNQEIDLINFQLEKSDKQLTKLMDLYLMDAFSKSVLNERVTKIEKEKEKLNLEMNRLKSSLSKIQKAYQAKTVNINEINKEQVRTIIDEILITPSNTVISKVAKDKTIEVKVTFLTGDTKTFLLSQRSNNMVMDGKEIPIIEK